MQSTTGFAYFVIFASVISLFMSIFFAIEFPVIVPYFERRGSRKEYFLQTLQVMLFMFMACSVALLTWAAVEPMVIGLPYKTLAILYIVIFFLYAIYAHKDFPMAKSSFQKYSIHIGLVFYMIMLPGLICFAISYKQLIQTADFREIDMLIQNSRIEFDGNYHPCSSTSSSGNSGNSGNNKSDGYCGAYKATFNVHWGDKWACPNNQDVSCDAWITEEDCIILTDNTTTTETEFATNAKLVQDCILEKYNLPAIGLLSKDLYPDQLKRDKDWPEISFYGTCSSRCATEPLTTDMYRFSERVKLTGLILSCSGAILFFIYYCVIFGKDMMDCCNICCNKSKKLRSLRHFAIVRLLTSDRVAPVNGGDTSNQAAGGQDSRDSSEFSIPPEIIREEMEEMEAARRALESATTRTPTTTTTTPAAQPVMVEASILYSDDDDDDSDEDDYSDDEDDDDEEYGSSGDDRSFDEEEEGEDSGEEEEESLNSCYESLDEIDLSVDPSYIDEESPSINVDTKTGKTAEVDEVEIDV